MKITDLQVDGFGVWKGLSVESISDEITVFCGENEAGKTTLMQFIRSMMFGFSAAISIRGVPAQLAAMTMQVAISRRYLMMDFVSLAIVTVFSQSLLEQ